MVVEAPISLAGVLPLAGRIVLRVMPKPIRKRQLFARLELWANSRILLQHFDATETARDRHVHWVAIQGAASILTRLDISHPEKDAGPDVWRPFLAHIVDAAEAGDITRARAVMARPEWSSMNVRSHFGAPSPPPPSTQPPEGPAGQPGERIYTARVPADILGQLKNWTTTMDMQQFAQRHVGKWIQVQNTIRDIGINRNTIFVIVGKQKFSPVIHLAFSREKWQPHLVSVRGLYESDESVIRRPLLKS